MFTPHDRIGSQFIEIGGSFQDLLNAFKLFGKQSKLLGGFYSCFHDYIKNCEGKKNLQEKRAGSKLFFIKPT